MFGVKYLGNYMLDFHLMWFLKLRRFCIQGLPTLNVGVLPSCRGPQIKKNSVKFFCKFAIFFAIFWNFFNINVCLKVHSFSYNNSILHNFFINDPHWKKNMIRRSQKKILITEKMRIFYLNTTTKKSSRFITLDQGLLTVEKFFNGNYR